MSFLSQTDPEINRAIECEKKRQKEIVNLIASENYASPAVLEAQGSFLTYKYAEGYPGKRYYGGCENMDTIEELAIKRAKELFTPSTPTSSRTAGRRRTWRLTSLYWNTAIPSWRWTLPTAGTSPTARR